MSNAQDLLSILGGARGASAPTAAAPRGGPAEHTVLRFRCGKMTAALKPNGKYNVEPDPRRGELHVVWTAGGGEDLRLEWKDRRTKTTVNSIRVFAEDDATFERVETGAEGDRVYLLQCGSGADARHFFWMQDKDAEPDEDICARVNLYMSDRAEAAAAAGAAGSDASSTATTDAVAAAGAAAGGGADNAELLRIMQGALGTADADGGAAPGGGSAGAGAVDALGNILENLGMPPPADSAGDAAAASAAATGGLTLADLQGAMAGLATASPNAAAAATSAAAAAASGPPLSELASAETISESGILDDPTTVQRLIALLPEGQRDEESLRETIRSPQVAQTLQRLTAALSEDAGSFNSIIANFQLDPSDGASAMMGSGNPIEAFLNCLLKDVEKKEGVKKAEDGATGDGGGEDAKEGGGEEKDGSGDVKMDES